MKGASAGVLVRLSSRAFHGNFSRWSHVQRCRCSEGRVTRDCQALCAVLEKCGSLKDFNVSNNSIGPDGAKAKRREHLVASLSVT